MFWNRNDEIGNRKCTNWINVQCTMYNWKNVQIVRGWPLVILSVPCDWFIQTLACSLIGWNLRRCSWLKLFFWGRRKQCKISVLGLFHEVRGFEFTSWCGNEFFDGPSFWHQKCMICLFTFADSSEPVRIPGRGWARAATLSARLHAPRKSYWQIVRLPLEYFNHLTFSRHVRCLHKNLIDGFSWNRLSGRFLHCKKGRGPLSKRSETAARNVAPKK